MKQRYNLVAACVTAARLAACGGASNGLAPATPASGIASDSQTRLAQNGVGSDAAHVQFAYVTNDGSDNVSAYKIESSGALTPVAGSPFGAGTFPFGVAIDPHGKFVYVDNVSSDNVSAYTINATSGALTPVTGLPFAAGSEPFGIATCRVTGGTCRPPPL
jgi:Lactonase, 7-bladed beta-propeller